MNKESSSKSLNEFSTGELGRTVKNSANRDRLRLITGKNVVNQDIAITSSSTILSRISSKVSGFLVGAIRYEWSAMFVSCLSALPSNLISCALVIWGADWMRARNFFESEAMYVSAVSILTGVIGYSTYLIMYYAGMLFKERRELYENGRLSWKQVKRMGRVIWYDFIIHLPADFFALPMLSFGQGGLYLAGVSQFWSIFWAQAIADASAAVKEPFFWHGAKKLAEASEARQARLRHDSVAGSISEASREPANLDIVSDTEDKVRALAVD
jgi:hypothetical protein